ncbi:MAG: hypothetical protein ACK4M3_08380, partial [Pyrobaculum sp.]
MTRVQIPAAALHFLGFYCFELKSVELNIKSLMRPVKVVMRSSYVLIALMLLVLPLISIMPLNVA